MGTPEAGQLPTELWVGDSRAVVRLSSPFCVPGGPEREALGGIITRADGTVSPAACVHVVQPAGCGPGTCACTFQHSARWMDAPI